VARRHQRKTQQISAVPLRRIFGQLTIVSQANTSIPGHRAGLGQHALFGI
jgi:hypothetical protein